MEKLSKRDLLEKLLSLFYDDNEIGNASCNARCEWCEFAEICCFIERLIDAHREMEEEWDELEEAD